MSKLFPEQIYMIQPSEFTLLREKTGMSVQEIGDLTGYTSRTIYRWENGESRPKKGIVDLLNNIARTKQTSLEVKNPTFTFIDLFAGIGGMRKGFESIGGKCVFTSEWNKYSQQTYLANFSCDHPIAGDITKVVDLDREIPKHNVLLAGFPCQPFSIAGVSKKNSLGRAHGFEDKTQGTLFYDVARIIAHHQPEAFLLENVKNLASHDKGRTLEVIMETLEGELGYTVQKKIIDAQGFVPQHRERIFIVGFRKDCGFSFGNMVIPDRELGPRLDSILHTEDGSESTEAPYTEGNLAKISDRYTLTPRLWEYLKEYAKKHKLKGNGFGYGLFGPDGVARTLSARYHKDGSEILIRRGKGRPRRLTPRECSRLMGFDRVDQKPFIIPVSDTQAYRQFGNAVVVPVIEAIARHMQPYLENAINGKPIAKKPQNKKITTKDLVTP